MNMHPKILERDPYKRTLRGTPLDWEGAWVHYKFPFKFAYIVTEEAECGRKFAVNLNIGLQHLYAPHLYVIRDATDGWTNNRQLH